MNWISIVFFGITFLIWCTMLKRGADILSPARVFGFTWSLVFGLANLKLSRLQFDWTLSQWVFVLMGPVSLLLGLFVSYVLHLGARTRSINDVRKTLEQQTIDESKLYRLIILAFLTYAAGYVTIGLVKGNLPIFARNPSAARTEFSVFGAGLFIHTMPIVVFFSIVYHLAVRGNVGKKWILKFVALSTVVTYLFLLQRYQLIMIAVMTFTLLYYTTRHIRFRTIGLFVTIGLILIYAVATLRSGKILEMALYISSAMRFSPRYAIFTEPYMYIAMNVENFVHGVSNLQHYTFGYYTFNFALAVTGLKHWIEGYFGIIDTPYLFSGYNTYTMFWTLYRDFGLIGISIIPFVGGFCIGFAYNAMRRKPTIRIVSFYSIVVFVMGLSFFVDLLGFLWFVYILAWMGVFLRFMRPGNLQENVPSTVVIPRGRTA